MKKLVLIASILATFTACNSVSGTYGSGDFTSTDTLTTTELVAQLDGKDSVYALVQGEISAACQAKGCWLTMDAGGQDLVVRFKDYGFFVPMNSAGYSAVMEGWAFVDTLSVAQQKEYARDANKSEEDIAAITEPQVKLTFLANGVTID